MLQLVLAAPQFRQRKNHRRLRPAFRPESPRAGALRVQVRAGLHRPDVSPRRAGGAQPQSGSVFLNPETVLRLYTSGAAGHGSAVVRVPWAIMTALAA